VGKVIGILILAVQRGCNQRIKCGGGFGILDLFGRHGDAPFGHGGIARLARLKQARIAKAQKRIGIKIGCVVPETLPKLVSKMRGGNTWAWARDQNGAPIPPYAHPSL
jgi:hypothetical protein